MIYSGTKIENFNEALGNYSVIVLLSENYKLLQKEAKKISHAIGGPNVESEMRITRYFNQEITGKRDEILSFLRTKSFFSGRQIIMLNGMPEKDYKIITEIASEWQNGDALTIVTMDKLSKNSELKKILGSNSKVALVNYSKNILNSSFLESKLAEDGIKFAGNEVIDALLDFSKFSTEEILENELEKLKVFKLYDDKPLTTEDFFNVVPTNYELNELSLAVALAEKNIIEFEKNLGIFFSQGKSPITILLFISAYFNKLSLIKLYGPNSFEVKREYPFLIANNLEKAKIQAQRWSLEQLALVVNSITVSDLKLRKHSSFFHRSILTQCLRKILEV
ncbi:hypothetical protein OA416_02820 [Paracoccaceae bacterium]|nr:hypothetical protein [Paracoccaceae bacterium]